MKSKIVLMFLLLISMMASANNAIVDIDEVYSKNETLDSCYSKPMSVAVNGCMVYLFHKTEGKYKAAFINFENKIVSLKDTFNDYDNFKSSIVKAEKNWKVYIENECQAWGHLNDYDSYAYYTDYNVCLINAYEARIKFYKEYKL